MAIYDINDIKKSLYKEKPNANFTRADKYGLQYLAKLKNGVVVYFRISYTDIGDAAFHPQEPAQLLIRWIM